MVRRFRIGTRGSAFALDGRERRDAVTAISSRDAADLSRQTGAHLNSRAGDLPT